MGNAPAAPGGQRLSFLSRLNARPLLWRMLMRQGIDPAERWWRGSEGLMERVLTRCLGCTRTDECHSWLSRAPLHTPPPEFCRNRNTLMACRNLERAVAPPPAAPESEPPLAEVTKDPIVQQLMAADGIGAQELHKAVDDGLRATAAKP